MGSRWPSDSALGGIACNPPTQPITQHRSLVLTLGGARCPPSTESPMAGPKLDGAGTEKMKTLEDGH